MRKGDRMILLVSFCNPRPGPVKRDDLNVVDALRLLEQAWDGRAGTSRMEWEWRRKPIHSGEPLLSNSNKNLSHHTHKKKKRKEKSYLYCQPRNPQMAIGNHIKE